MGLNSWLTGNPEVDPHPGRIAPEKRIIKRRPFKVGFDRSHQRLQEGARS
jgi:hypothetical protein